MSGRKSVVLISVRRFTPAELEFCHDVPFGDNQVAYHVQRGRKIEENREPGGPGQGFSNGGFKGSLTGSYSKAMAMVMAYKDKGTNSSESKAEASSAYKAREQSKGGNDKGKSKLKTYLGLILAFGSAICFSAAGLTSKMLAEKKTNHPFNIALWKYQGMTILGPILLIYFRCIKKDPIFDSIWPLNTRSRQLTLFFLIIRGTVGVATMILTTYALKFLKLADTTVIVMSTPIAVTLFARVCLGEPCGFVPIGTAILTLVGVGILMRPPILTGEESFDINTLIGTAIALMAMLFLTSVFLILRFLRTVHFSLFIFFYSYVASAESIVLGLCFGVLSLPKTTEDYCIAAVSGLLGVLGQLCITFALKFENASPVSLIRTSEIVFSFVLQFLFLGVTPDWLSLVGASIVLSGLVITTLRKWLTVLPHDHPARKKYRFLLV